MLDTIFRNGSGRKQGQDELRDLVTQAREERESLELMLARIGSEGDAHVREARNNAAALRQESEHLEELRAQLRQATADVARSTETIIMLKGELETLRRSEAQLNQELQGIREGARVARDDASAATAAVQAAEHKLQAFARLQDLSEGTEQRLTALNALAEHVSHKTKALEAQKHTVERAVVEATRLNEMVWNMDAQIARLHQGGEQMRQTEENIARMEALARTTVNEVNAAGARRDDFLREVARVEAQGGALSEQLRASVDRLSIEKEEIDAFDQRLQAMARAVNDTQASLKGLMAKQDALVSMERKADAVTKAFAAWSAKADELSARQVTVDALAAQLAQVEALGKRTASQHDSLLRSQQQIDEMRQALGEVHQTRAEASVLRDRLAADRAALDSFGERAAAMMSRVPEIDTRIQAVLDKLGLIDAGNRSATLLSELADDLSARLERLDDRMQFVEKLEQRVDNLHGMTAEVDQKLADQLARSAEVAGVKNQCDTLLTQLLDAQQKLCGVAALQARVMSLPEQVATLTQSVERSHQLVQAVKLDESALHKQRAQLVELVEQGKTLSTESAERLQQVRDVAAELDRAASLKQSLLSELAQVQAAQHDAVAQTEAAEDRIQRAEAMARQLDQRCARVLDGQAKVTALEGRLDELDRGADRVEQKIHALGDQEALVQAVKAEVENIRQVSERSKADLQHLGEQRGALSELRTMVDDLLGRLHETDEKIATIESQREMVDEVQARANGIVHMLKDLNINLDMVGEQRAAVDEVGGKLARLEFTLQEANNTIRALQREREAAARSDHGTKTLRTRGAPAAEPTSAEG
jgi:chromosome segregation ATPase